VLDRAAFIKPIAHRGLHDAAAGRIENTAAAFEAGLARGFGVECDLQPLADGTPVVFHDDTAERLLGTPLRIDRMDLATLRGLRHTGSGAPVLTYGEFLELCAGRGPLLVEIKSGWRAPHDGFLEKIAALSRGYKGPIALMSFDPRVMAAMAGLAPELPRGIVAGRYEGNGWWIDEIGLERAQALSDLLESGPARPAFYAYHVKSLPTPVTRYAREVQGLALFTWTVRTPAERRVAADWADAPIFEGYVP
jgi:glycerophosphoryl diester phosphodiesterase